MFHDRIQVAKNVFHHLQQIMAMGVSEIGAIVCKFSTVPLFKHWLITNHKEYGQYQEIVRIMRIVLRDRSYFCGTVFQDLSGNAIRTRCFLCVQLFVKFLNVISGN